MLNILHQKVQYITHVQHILCQIRVPRFCSILSNIYCGILNPKQPENTAQDTISYSIMQCTQHTTRQNVQCTTRTHCIGCPRMQHARLLISGVIKSGYIILTMINKILTYYCIILTPCWLSTQSHCLKFRHLYSQTTNAKFIV